MAICYVMSSPFHKFSVFLVLSHDVALQSVDPTHRDIFFELLNELIQTESINPSICIRYSSKIRIDRIHLRLNLLRYHPSYFVSQLSCLVFHLWVLLRYLVIHHLHIYISIF